MAATSFIPLEPSYKKAVLSNLTETPSFVNNKKPLGLICIIEIPRGLAQAPASRLAL